MADEPAGPLHDEVEVSLFGPGYGECALLHIGAGEWMIVDSCVAGGEQPAISYLLEIGVDVRRDVKLIVATHWHDDHVRGMASLVELCEGARFACSTALEKDEVWGGFATFPTGHLRKLTSGVDEMRRVQNLLSGGGRPSPKWAVEDRLLFERSATGAPKVSVTALAPSDRTVTRAYQSISSLLQSSVDIGTVPAPARNDASVVLSVDIGDASVLLGGDLETTPGDSETGWAAVVGLEERSRRRRAEVFKIPHHGSEGAHYEPVWSKMLIEAPEAVLTPWRRGRSRLPTASDLERLCLRATQVHLSSVSSSGEGRRTSTQLLAPRRVPGLDMGRVTLRRRIGATRAWDATYWGPALPVCAAGE